MTDSPSTSSVLWRPTPEQVVSTNIFKFANSAAPYCVHGQGLDYEALWRWSVSELGNFWSAIWKEADPLCATPCVEMFAPGQTMLDAQWGLGATFNFAQNLLRHEGDRPALVSYDERGRSRVLSADELRREVRTVQRCLKDSGVKPGDRVAGYLPNIPEAVVCMLATTSLGAIWSSCSPDFGVPAVLDRFSQITPKVLISADGYLYGGKAISLSERIRAIAEGIPELTHIFLVQSDIEGVASAEPCTKPVTLYREVTACSDDSPLEFANFPFDYPVYILFSSGTTGLPKCIVHGAGGTLLQHYKELALHSDVRPGDRLLYFTTCGWMMWNWLVSGLYCGATVYLYDGSPFYPDAEALLKIAERERLTLFGTSARYLSALEKAKPAIRGRYEFGELRSILSTGSPLVPSSFDFVYRELKQNLCLSSISGGTDIISCFALGCPTRPVIRGELQVRGLGMNVEVLNEQGKPVLNEPGELVCTSPFPSMPVGFWNDAGRARYRSTYFSKFNDRWCHADWVTLTEHRDQTGGEGQDYSYGMIIHGRSDATLNPSGVRIGTAELYRVLETFPEISESAVIDQRWDGDTRIVVFVKLADPTTDMVALSAEVRRSLRSQLSPRHVPAKIVAVPDIPKTMNGKTLELAIRKTVHGEPVENLAVVSNPEALEFFKAIPELSEP